MEIPGALCPWCGEKPPQAQWISHAFILFFGIRHETHNPALARQVLTLLS